MRKDYQPGVLAPSQKSESEIAARDEFNRKHPPIEGLVVPHDLRKRSCRNVPGGTTAASGSTWPVTRCSTPTSRS